VVEAAEAAAETEAVEAALDAATEAALARAAEASTRLPAAERAAVMEAVVDAADMGPEVRAERRAAVRAIAKRAAALAYFDISHKERILGQWPVEIQRDAVWIAKNKALDLFVDQKEEQYEKYDVKKHMGSMLGDWDKAGKQSKRRIKKKY